MTNREIIATLTLIANLLQIKGEVIYKILAYRKAAEGIEGLGRDVRDIWAEGKLNDIPGVGKAIAQKLDELLATGEMSFLTKLNAEVPASLNELMEVPDLGPKKIKLFWQELGVTNLAELKAAAEEGKLRELPKMGAKSEAKILAGIESLSRRSGRVPLGNAWPIAQGLLDTLRAIDGVARAEVAGSLRRMRETVGDIDILVAAADSAPIMEAFTTLPEVDRVLGKGETKASVEFRNGMRAQVWVHPPEKFGTALQYATGSQHHNVKLRELALDQGYSLSEHALTPTDGGDALHFATEEALYEKLGLAWVPPELREDRGEVKAAVAADLPRQLQSSDLKSDLHTHSTWSDGKASIKTMALRAHALGMTHYAVTDHSYGLGITQGVDADALKRQRAEIDAAQAELDAELGAGAFTILQGVEMEIRADGTLDFPDEVLAELDIVIASLHVSLRQDRETITNRLLNAIRNPHVDMIGHPTGRLIPDREGADLDMDAVFAAAKESGVALEINAHPRRLDLSDVYVRRAVEMGIPISLNTDAHHPDQLGETHYGVATARRGWLEPDQVINTWDRDRLLNWLRSR